MTIVFWIGDGYLRNWAEPRDARLAVLVDGVIEERQDVGADVVAAQRQRSRPGLLVLPAVVVDIAGKETICRASETLGAKSPLEPPWPPPQLV